MRYVLYTLIGFFIGFTNYSLLLYTVKILKKSKKVQITIISYYLRIILVLFLFAIFMNKNIQNLFLILLGFFISKILFLFIVKKNKIKI